MSTTHPSPGRPTTRRVRFGLGPLTGQAPGGDGDELALALASSHAAEQHGLDDVWISEHHVTADGHISSPLTILAALAASTSAISLGTDVAIAPLYHPQRLMADASLISQLSHGRLLLGLGAGYRTAEFQTFGVPRRERFARLEETIQALGSRRPAGGQRAGTGPPPWPVLLAGMREAGVRRAGRLADGWIAPTLSHVGQLHKRIGWLAEEGAFSRPFHVLINMTVFVGDRSACRRASRGIRTIEQRYASWLNAPGRQTLTPIAEAPEGATPLPPHAIVAGPAQCATALTPWHEALLRTPANVIPHMSARLHFPGVGHDETLESVRQFATQVVPRLRDAAPAGPAATS